MSILKRYLEENFDDLLALDLKVARLLGAPAPHTLSSYSYKLELENKPFGAFFRPIIDFLAETFFKDFNHCQGAYERVQRQINGDQLPEPKEETGG
jgi:hypothetical protein